MNEKFNTHFLSKLGVWVDRVGTNVVYYFFCVAVTVLLWVGGYSREAQIFLIGTVVLVVVVQLLKRTIQSARGGGSLVETDRYAFPSGHAAASASLAILVPYIAYEIAPHLFVAALSFFIALAVVVGGSRVLVRAHTLAQVLAGAALGVAIPLVIIVFYP